jgi:hypothetical protein
VNPSAELAQTARDMPAVYAETTMSRLVERLSGMLTRRAGSSVRVEPAEPGDAHLLSVVCDTRRARTAAIALLVEDGGRAVMQTADVVRYEGERAIKTFIVWVK